MLPAIFLSLLFLVPAWWCWRIDRKVWAIFPALACLGLLVLTITVQLQDTNRTQCRADLDVLLEELNQPDLWETTDLTNKEELLYLASSASMALYRSRAHFPDRQSRIDATLLHLAEWVAKEGSLPQWRNHRSWDLQVFFLAHAGATLGHYQLATQDAETFRTAFTDVGEHLGQRLRRGRYKHLISRPEEEYFRPADNAAALYALRVYDLATGM
ncbi:MAG: hypothetical protein AAF597_04185 [Bacteroidota bacterium]